MRPCWVIGLALAVCGCGVEAYEKKMEKAQKDHEYFEAQNRFLDAPLQIPLVETKEGNKTKIANLFLRPPKGISAKCSNPADPRGGKLYTYDPPPKSKVSGPCQRVELAFGGDQKEFASEVLATFPGAGEQKSKEQQVRAPIWPNDRPTLKFEIIEFTYEQSFISVNIWRAQKRQVAVVYWIDPTKRSQAAQALKMSLETFGMDGGASFQQGLHSRGSPLNVVPTASP